MLLSSEPYNYSPDFLIDLYQALLTPRLIEEKMLLLLRQGKISKWFSGVGEEACSVGATAALLADEYIFTLHRNLGVFTTRGVPLENLFAQFQGKLEGFTKGRDRSFHFGVPDYHIVGMISHLGPQLTLADGVGLADRIAGTQRVTLAYTGEGGSSEGDFHEALNVASVYKLPVIFMVIDNHYALSTPVVEQFACERLSDRAKGYGMEGITIDGNDVLGVYATVRHYAEKMRSNPAPVLIECKTFRMRGHEEASGVAYVPEELFTEWQKRDPISLYERSLLERGLITKEQIASIHVEISAEIEQAVEYAFARPDITPTVEAEVADVYAPFKYQAVPVSNSFKKMRFVDAIADALNVAMENHPQLILMGQDIAEYGGVFKITAGLLEKYGKERVRNTPLCESAILGMSLGLALKGYKSMVEMQFADFVSSGFNQIINNLAKVYYRWGQAADVVVRLPCGAGVGAGPFHSQTMETWFTHCPGLKIAYPAFPDDAKGLLLTAFEDPNPVMFFEHKKLYRSVDGLVPEGDYRIPFGQARLIQEGSDVTIVSYGLGVHWAMQTLERNPDISADLLDLRTLQPLDYPAIFKSVRKTGRVIILHEASLTSGFGGEIAARINEECFTSLDAPVMRSASLDTPIPFARELEDQYLASSHFEEDLIKLLLY